MPITFTEDDFKTGTTNAPLTFSEADFAPSGPGPKKSRKAIEKEVAKAQTMRPPIEEQGMIGRAAGAIMPFAESLTPQGWMRAMGTVATEGMNLPARAYSALMPNQTPPFVINRDTQTLSQGAPIPFNPTPFQQGVPTVRLPQSRALQLGEVQEEPLTQVVRETIEGFTTPEGWVTLPATAAPGLTGRAAAGLFLGQTVPEAGRQAIEALTTDDPRERELATMRAVLNTIFSGLLGKQVRGPEVPRSGLTGQDFPPPHPADWASRGETAPLSMQLPERTYTAPTYESPAGGARFPVDPLGRAVDVSQLSPKEQIELMRGPKEFVPRETYVSPAQQPPAILPAPIQLRRLAPPLAPEPVITPAQALSPRQVEPMFPPAGPMPYPQGLPSQGEVVTRQSGVPSRLLAKEVEGTAYSSQLAPQPPPPYAPTIPSPQAQVPPVGNVRGTGGTPRSGGPQQLGEEVGGQGLRGPGIRQEAPQQGREVIKLAAFRDPETGKVYTGSAHSAIDWPEGMTNYEKQNFEMGFTTSRNRFVEYEQGLEIGTKAHLESQSQAPQAQGLAPEPPATPSAPRLYAGESMIFDPEFYKQTGKQVGKYARGLAEYFKGAAPKVVEALDFQKGAVLPDLQEKGKANKIFSQPFGTEGMPVVGRLMGGKARIRTPADEAVATWYGERHGVGPAIASSIGENMRGQVNSVFKVGPDGNLNVKPNKPGQSLAPSDVFEALRNDPLAYNLTLPQRRAYNEQIAPLTKRMTELAEKYDLIDAFDVEGENLRPYFPRIVLEHPKQEGQVGRGPGLTNPLKTRAFKTEAEGISKGYKYEPDLEKRLVSGVERLYRAIANARLANDPVLNPRTPKQVKSQLMEAYAEELAAGEMTVKQIDRMVEGIRSKGSVNQPILFNKIFDPKMAQVLNKEFRAEQSRIRKSITSANSFVKGLSLGFDFGAGQIQLLPTLYNNPRIWAESQARAMHSFVSPEAFSKYVRQNKEVVSELAQMGSSVGRLQEHMSGLGEQGVIGRVPVVGIAAKAFGRHYQTALDVAKIEFYKALRGKAQPKELPELVRAIESITLTGRTESAMVPHGRALIERVLTLAPTYYRGAIEHVAALGQKGVSGKVARESMGKFILGSIATFYGIAKMLDMSDEEIQERLNPARSDFLMWKLKQKDGSVVNQGFGGIFRSLLRLGGNMVKTSVEHPENWKSLAPDKNPISRWYRGHAGPVPAMIWEGFTGKDFLGRESDLTDLGKRALPMAVAEGFRRPEEQAATPAEYASSVMGLATQPEPFSERRNREVKEASNRLYLKEYGELTFKQRAHVDKTVDKKLEGVKTGLTEARARDIAIKKADERFKALQEGLDPEVKAWLGEKGLKVRNYQLFKTLAGQQIRLAPDEQEVFEQSIKEEYEKQLRFVMGRQRQTQDYLDKRLELARSDAWKEVRRYIASKRTGVQTPAMPQ